MSDHRERACPRCGSLLHYDCREPMPTNPDWRALCTELAEALEQAEGILWMASEYASAGGSGGPEWREYVPAAKAVDAALAAYRSATTDRATHEEGEKPDPPKPELKSMTVREWVFGRAAPSEGDGNGDE